MDAVARQWMVEHTDAMAKLTGRRPTSIPPSAVVSDKQIGGLLAEVFVHLAGQSMGQSMQTLPKPIKYSFRILGRLMGKSVAGLYLPEWQAPGHSGLYLVKNRIEASAAKVDAKPLDLARYVAAHEATHHWQFAANPWLEQYMVDNYTGLMDSAQRAAASGQNQLGAIQGSMEKLNATMSLVEGHADFMAQQLLPADIAAIGKKLSQQRDRSMDNQSAMMQVVGRLSKMDQKLRQYSDGYRFCEQVHKAGGHALLDQAWQSPQTLPSAAEIADPALWVRRMQAPAQAAA